MSYFRTIFSYLRSLFPRRTGRTVRYMFPLVAGLATLLGAQLISSVDSSYIRLEVDKQAVQTSERFTVDVYAYAHVPVNAIDVTIRFDGSRVEVREVDRGQSVLTIWTEDPIVSENSVILRGGTFRRGFLGEHKIASIDLEAKGSGTNEFVVSDLLLLAGDGQGSPVTTTESDQSAVSLYVYDEGTDPSDINIEVTVDVITDLDGDGEVTLRDISAFMADWSNQTRSHDFNGDGRMTFRDFSILLASFFFQ